MADLSADDGARHGRLVTLARHDDVIAVIQMIDAAGRNGLSEPFVQALRAAFRAAGDDPGVKVIVLRGLPEVFCSGATLQTLERLTSGETPLDELSLPEVLIDAPVPVIAAMEGDAVGGGFALGLAADIIMMCETSRYGLNFMDLGLTPGMGVTRLAPDGLGQPLAHELMYTGEHRRGRDFRCSGLINYILAKRQLMAKALDVAARIGDKPRSALTLLKTTLAAERRAAFRQARKTETAMHRICLADPETAERIKANYVE